MSTLRDAMSHAALGWVKPELDETLRQVRSEVEAYVEEPSDTGRMRFCAGYLHQVQGTLRMVELYAPAMVAEEMELLANAVREDAVPDREEACATLMRGTVLLPDYLERLQNGHRDIPIVLLPLLNEIRAARGAEGINESVLFAFNPDAGDASPAELEHARGSLSGRNRELLDTVGGAVKEELMRIKDALDLHVRTGGNPADLQVQVNELGAVSDTLGVMGLGVARGIVAQQRDALRDVVSGNRNIDDNLLLDIAGALLYVDASLDDQVAHLGASTAGEDDPASVETRRTVEVLAHEAIANFTAARESFVAFIETSWDHQRLTEVPRLLGEVAGALRMLDLPAPADYLQAVREYIKVELVERQRVPSGRQLDTLADAMASLEYYLEALRDRRPGREDILDITRSSLEALNYWPLPSASAAPVVAVPAAETVAAPAWGLDPIARPDAVEPVQDVPSAAIEADVPDSAWSVEPVAASPAIASLHDAAETAHVAVPAADWNVEPLVEALAPAEMQQETFEEAPVAGQDAAAQTAVAAPSGPPPLPPLAEAPAAARQEYPLVFGAAINAKPVPVAEPPVIAQTAAESLPYATQSTGFDPVAAEAPAQQDSTYTLAPIALEGHLDTEPSLTGDALHGSFDPVAAESDAAAVASDTYSFDSSLLELEMEPVAASVGATQAPAHVEMSLADGFFEADLEEPVTVAEASTNAGAWQLEEITASVQDDGALQLEQHSAGTAATDWQLQDIEPELVASDDGARDAAGSLPADVTAEGDAVTAPDVTASAQDNVPEPVLEDAEAAAFLAELDAAAAAFDPFAQPAVEAVAPQEAAEAAVATTTVAAATVPALDGGFIDNGEDIDQDIRDVFIEEFDEELENLGKLLPAWRAAPANMERLRPVRRVFHTLKGSGRLVGARTLGEFSWKIESMLNRVLDGSRPASPAVLALVGQAYDVLPELNAALRGSGSIHSDLLAIQDVADRVAAGEEAFYVAGASEAAAPPVAAVPQTEVPVQPADVADVLDGTPASVDSVLREILEAEIGVHLGTVNAWLLQSATQPQAVSEDLLRAVHTMSGAFAMTDVPVITGITTPAESFVKRSLAAGIVPGVAGVAALAQMAAAVDATISALRQPSPRIPAFPGLAERLQALVDGLPDAKWPPMALDDELPPVPADTVPETAEVTAPAKAELVAMEDLSAYFDKSMLEDTLGELPSFTAPVVPEATPAPLVEAPAARWGEPTPSAASAPSDAVAAALSIVAGLSARSADQAEVTAPVDAVEATAAEAPVEADDVGVAALQVEAGEAEAIEVEAVEAEAVEVDAVEAEAVEAEAVEAEAVEAEAVEAEAVEAEAVEAEAVEAEAVEAEAVEAEAVEAEAVEAEAVEAEAVEAEAVEAEAVEAEA
ncbi:Hpt domain-containing protein, partial [Stenotrophomonas sp.]|uniref:Hpt domain-containing protein n=1 Tax=Stenotrophomonas sp. TaxID=69392 RepID=UPI0028B03069